MFSTIESGLKNKTVIVTGATYGIGMACAEAFCYAGANVVIAARSDDKGAEVSSRFSKKWNVKCMFVHCDTSSEADVKSVVSKTAEAFGHIDVLINCAGYWPAQKPIDECSIADFERILNVNLKGYYMFAKYTLPYLRSTKGCIVNIGSVIGMVGKEGATMYCSTKGAIHSLTQALAIDEARNGVRVNEIRPGHIRNEGHIAVQNSLPEEEAKKFAELHNSLQWMGRGGEMDEVAKAVLFLSSDWASFITGTSLNVTGGYEIGEGIKKPLHSWNIVKK